MIGFAYIYFQNIFAKSRRVCPFYVFIVGMVMRSICVFFHKGTSNNYFSNGELNELNELICCH